MYGSLHHPDLTAAGRTARPSGECVVSDDRDRPSPLSFGNPAILSELNIEFKHIISTATTIIIFPSLFTQYEPTRYVFYHARIHWCSLHFAGREAFQRLAQQFAKAQRQATAGGFGRGGAGGSGGPGGAKGFLAGSGLLVTLALGGIAINQSLFNGAFSSALFSSVHCAHADSLINEQLMVVTERSSTPG